MKKYSIWMLGILLLFPSLVFAADIPLPQGLNAKAFVTKGVRDGLWEKTLIVRFSEKIRTGGHNRIGELIGKAAYEAVIEALLKQNGFKIDLPH